MVPHIEDGIIPGHSPTTFTFNGNKDAVEICRDLDYLNPSNNYAKDNTSILFAPAWDFFNDGWSHLKGAYLRGIENRIILIRAAYGGYSTVSTNTGKLLLNAPPSKAMNQVFVVKTPIDKSGTSFYAQYPYGFPGLFIIILLALIVQTLWKIYHKKINT